jgi:cbb3-type cytochrome oxidase subunit 3
MYSQARVLQFAAVATLLLLIVMILAIRWASRRHRRHRDVPA